MCRSYRNHVAGDGRQEAKPSSLRKLKAPKLAVSLSAVRNDSGRSI
jgi:hypothetical protein